VNYFNYYTEIEEHFQRARGTGTFRVSPLDWALIETWQEAGVPLEAVLRGIDVAFEKWRARKSKVQRVNSLTYCAQSVMTEAQMMAGTVPERAPAPAPFTIEEVRAYLEANAAALRRAEFSELAAALERILGDLGSHYADLEELDRRLTALEEKMVAIARAAQPEEELLAGRRELDFQLRPYRGKMTAEQLAMLERKFLDRKLLESAGLPRLSLFYIR
jgi:hypothetical protein